MLDFSFAELFRFLLTLYCMYLASKSRGNKRKLRKNSRTPRQR